MFVNFDFPSNVKLWITVLAAVLASLTTFYAVSVQAGWIMTREAHAQDVLILQEERDEILQALRADAAITREYARSARQYAACVYFKIDWSDCQNFDPPARTIQR